MAREIERKFLVSKRNFEKIKKKALVSFEVQQGYLSRSDKHTIRIRITRQPGDGSKPDTVQGYITVKGKMRGITRDEFEYRIPLGDAMQMLKMCDSQVLKTRHIIPNGGTGMWDVDMFRGINKGLIMAELEMETEDMILDLPDWVGREVTHDKRYTNAQLSIRKAPKM